MAKLLSDVATTITSGPANAATDTTFSAHDGVVTLPDPALLFDAQMTRQGSDLALSLPSGEVILIVGYFSAAIPPVIKAGEAQVSAAMIESFLNPAEGFVAADRFNRRWRLRSGQHPTLKARYSSSGPTGPVKSLNPAILSGRAIRSKPVPTVRCVSPLMMNRSSPSDGTPACRLTKWSMTRMARARATALSLLRGGFTFVSGLIAKVDPEATVINTPVATIGVRGTTLSGYVDVSATLGRSLYSITVLDGAVQITNFAWAAGGFHQPAIANCIAGSGSRVGGSGGFHPDVGAGGAGVVRSVSGTVGR